MPRSDRSLALGVVVLVILAGSAWFWWSQDDEPVAPGIATEDSGVAGDVEPEAADLDRGDAVEPRRDVATDDRDANAASAATDETPSPTELWGRVVRASDDTAIAGASVRLQHRAADEFWNLDLAYGAKVDELARTTSGRDGGFRFDVTRSRQHRLVIEASGFASQTVVDCTGGSTLVVRMTGGATIDGVVRSAGVGIADAEVEVAVVGQSVQLALGRTELDGTFRFENLQATSVYVQVRSPHHEEQWERVELRAGATHEVEVELPVGKTLRGRVVDAVTGAGIPDAQVSDSWTFERVVRTDGNGGFALGGLDEDGYTEIEVRASGYASASRAMTGKLDELAVFELVQGGIVVGRFVDATTGKPAARVYAAVGASFSDQAGMQSTDWLRATIETDGTFAVGGLRPDQSYWLFARGRGYGTRVYALPRRLDSGERLDVGDVALRPGCGIEGRVVDDAGEPLGGVEVSLRGRNADHLAWRDDNVLPTRVTQFEDRDVVTNDDGRFGFTGLAVATHTLSVHPRNNARSVELKVELTEPGQIVTDVELVVPRGATIAGTMRYADGRAWDASALRDLRLSAWREDGSTPTTRVGDDGSFRFTGLDVGESYVLMASFRPNGWIAPPVRDVQAGREDVEIVLEPASYVSGRVLDEDGEPIQARVWIRYETRARGGSPLHVTAEDGTFRLEVPSAFVGEVGAMHMTEFMRQKQVEGVRAGAEGLEIRLERR